jgi:rhodanese-related sulfurtransferase
MTTISRDELRRKLNDSPGRVLLIDVRDRGDYEEERIKGAISIPLGELSMRAAKCFGTEHEIIVYCGSFECQASSKAAKVLDRMGYANVLEYEGGLKDWRAAGFVTEGAAVVKKAA